MRSLTSPFWLVSLGLHTPEKTRLSLKQSAIGRANGTVFPWGISTMAATLSLSALLATMTPIIFYTYLSEISPFSVSALYPIFLAYLSEKQVEFAETIYSSGADLLALINEILDLSKIESGAMGVDIGDLAFTDMQTDIEHTFRQVAEDKGLYFNIELDERLPQSIRTNAKRLQQVLKNLLSNAIKFTHEGGVTLRIEPVMSGWSFDQKVLSNAEGVIAFSVMDTVILLGILIGQ